MIKQTAGRDQLGEFAPKFAELNDDILFGEVWSREGVLSLKTRSILTVTVLKWAFSQATFSSEKVTLTSPLPRMSRSC